MPCALLYCVEGSTSNGVDVTWYSTGLYCLKYLRHQSVLASRLISYSGGTVRVWEVMHVGRVCRDGVPRRGKSILWHAPSLLRLL